MIDLIGQTFGRLIVIERGPNIRHRKSRPNGDTSWRCQCSCGNIVNVTKHSLKSGHTVSCGCVSELLGFKGKPVITYKSMHNRVSRKRGSASNYLCVDCKNQADEWSYNHLDANELHGFTGRGIYAAYSLDPANYDPRCKPCHRTFDRMGQQC
jgi:hypothetical protein